MLRRMAVLALSFVILVPTPADAQRGGVLSGTVRDTTGAVVADAEVKLLTPQLTVAASARSAADGTFRFVDLAPGAYVLEVTFPGFAAARQKVTASTRPTTADVVLQLSTLHDEVSVTASLGTVEDARETAQPVTVVDREEIAERAATVVAQAAEEEVGVNLQRTSPTIAGIVVRGLTGNKVNVYIDGVRYSTSAQRGGINTFLDLIEPSTLEAIEILRGPNSAQYGSDALGGSVQFLARVPGFSSTGAPMLRGHTGITFTSAHRGFGGHGDVTWAGRRFGVMVNAAGRQSGDLRPGGGIDSHAAVTRFFGVRSDELMDERLPDTGFSQYGGLFKAHWAPTDGMQIVVSYLRGQQEGAKRYDQLLGGDGNLIADLRHLTLDLGYVRLERSRTLTFDRLTAIYSINSQREERVNQGGSGDPRAPIAHEPERLTAHGLQLTAGRQFGTRLNLVTGGDFYAEGIEAPSFSLNPDSGASEVRRGRVPDGATYRSGGAYMQTTIDGIAKRVRLVGNVRVSGASYGSRADTSPIVNGRPLWPDDSLAVWNTTFRAGAIASLAGRFSVSGAVSRGFRAPHITDLGTLGLTGSGFEVAAPDLAGLGATIGTSAAASAVTSGMPVEQVKSESSLNVDVGAHWRAGTLSTDVAVFVNTIYDILEKYALILPPGAVGLRLGGQEVIVQGSTGVVFVAASPNPVLARANRDDARIVGLEHTVDWRPSAAWTLSTAFSWVRAYDLRTGTPPSIEGGTPAPHGHVKVVFRPTHARFWAEPFVRFALSQDRLSSLDLEDRRTGATRSRTTIRNFFANGATARGWVAAGADRVLGTADDVLTATGETLAQIQQRVLGDATSAPLFTSVASWVTLNARFGLRLGTRHQIRVALENLTDENYRGISWGMDAPGRSVLVTYRTSF